MSTRRNDADLNIFYPKAIQNPRIKRKSHTTPSPQTPPPQPNYAAQIDPETKAAIQRLKDLKSMFQTQLAEAFKNMGYVGQDFSTFINDPKNFPPETWAQIQTFKKQFLDQLQLKNPAFPQPVIKTKKDLDKEEKTRKSKTLGSRRNWIQVR